MQTAYFYFQALVTVPVMGAMSRNGSISMLPNPEWERLLASPDGIDTVARAMKVAYFPLQGDKYDSLFSRGIAREIALLDVSIKDAGSRSGLRVVSVDVVFFIDSLDFASSTL